MLPNSKLDDKDAATIAAALADSKSIKKVDLRGNDMSDVGCLAFTKCLEKNFSLRTLELDGNGKISTENRTKLEGQLEARAAKAA